MPKVRRDESTYARPYERNLVDLAQKNAPEDEETRERAQATYNVMHRLVTHPISVATALRRDPHFKPNCSWSMGPPQDVKVPGFATVRIPCIGLFGCICPPDATYEAFCDPDAPGAACCPSLATPLFLSIISDRGQDICTAFLDASADNDLRCSEAGHPLLACVISKKRDFFQRLLAHASIKEKNPVITCQHKDGGPRKEDAGKPMTLFELLCYCERISVGDAIFYVEQMKSHPLNLDAGAKAMALDALAERARALVEKCEALKAEMVPPQEEEKNEDVPTRQSQGKRAAGNRK
jgi:hypothetical protein